MQRFSIPHILLNMKMKRSNIDKQLNLKFIVLVYSKNIFLGKQSQFFNQLITEIFFKSNILKLTFIYK